jgi:hypothetical protein
MTYWIHINGSDRGPYSSEDIAKNFGPSLPSNTPCARVGENKWSTLGALLPEIGSGTPAPQIASPTPSANWIAMAATKKVISYCILLVACALALPFYIAAEKTNQEGYRVVCFALIGTGWIASFFLPAQIIALSDQNPTLSITKVIFLIFESYLTLSFLIPGIGPVFRKIIYKETKLNPFVADENDPTTQSGRKP